MEKAVLLIVPLLAGYMLDLWLGDPESWPHPVKLFGNMIAFGEKRLNNGNYRFVKGMLLTVLLVVSVFLSFWYINKITAAVPWLYLLLNSVLVWYGLANKTLIREGREVFQKLEMEGVAAGRMQLSRIVGRDTSRLSAQQIRIAVLETMSENLSDGVVAPLFFYLVAGVPGMMAYKMVNTLDSMIGYRNARYEQFGKFAARLDDVANLIPARLTAFLMVFVTGSWRGLDFMLRFGNKHKSPNAGLPEAALAGILNCRFGGPNAYHDVLVDKPYIGETEREIAPCEIANVSRINHLVCFAMILLVCIIMYLTIN
ncbi:adenosylcobinamide-phosphate synthase CbiB [Dyadobacter sp. Leaf189]|uniref:adenosylcobinamide-phosphate synthase CbiB n=1 Tax=Dyadobacter sp. Leaf189 TaxID=1736295 RepID=UPI0006F9600E|nr:adenosylcobinamide-phosphate synthase CbiB [Dyadobacter sp. Leaf189]KQS30928.1 cobalamin biosynthesis protein CobD [Dyadobacter sp. Leaf189]